MAEKDMNKQNEHISEQEDSSENQYMDINADDNISGTTHLQEPLTEESGLGSSREDELTAENAELKDKLLRQAAEFDNFRKRTAKERLELIQTAGKDVITRLLEVLDDSERAEKQMETSDDLPLIKEGVQLVFAKLKKILADRGLKPMDTVKQDFDADLHEAITEIAAPAKELKGKVLDEVEKGYYLNDKIIRYAKVVVGK